MISLIILISNMITILIGIIVTIDGNGNINTGYVTAWDIRANGAFYGRVA